MGKDNRVFDLLDKPTPVEDPKGSPSQRPPPPPPPPPRVPRGEEDLYQEDREWAEYLKTGHLPETDGPLPPPRPTERGPKAGPHLLGPKPARWAPKSTTPAAIRAGEKYHREAMKVTNTRAERYNRKQAKDFHLAKRREIDQDRLAALNTETFNELFNVPATGRPIVSNYQLSQSRQIFDFNPKAEAVAAHQRALRENRDTLQAPIYPIDYGIYGK